MLKVTCSSISTFTLYLSFVLSLCILHLFCFPIYYRLLNKNYSLPEVNRATICDPSTISDYSTEWRFSRGDRPAKRRRPRFRRSRPCWKMNWNDKTQPGEGPVIGDERRIPVRESHRTRLMGPLRRDGFLLNAEPLAYVRSFYNFRSPLLFPSVSLSLFLSLSHSL